MSISKQACRLCSALVVVSALLIITAHALAENNKVLGEIEFAASNPAAKHAGVWVDGQYLGFLHELKGAKAVLLMPGKHTIVVREAGYTDFTEEVLLEPGQKQTLPVTLTKDPQAHFPAITAEVKLEVTPNRAAVFVDDKYLGPVHDFGGLGRALLVSPGKHRIKIALPGYQTFETEISLLPKQKYTVKTDLAKGSIAQSSPLLKER